MTDARVFNESAEVLAQGVPDARVFNESVEVLAQGVPDARVFNESVEVLIGPPAAQTLSPSGIATGQAFGTPTLALGVTPTGVVSGGALGTPTVTPGVATVAPGGIASATAFGTAAFATEGVIAPAGIASSGALGAPTVHSTSGVAPSGIASTTALGTPTVSPGVETLLPSGIASATAFGTPSVSTPGLVFPPGIPGGGAVGEPAVLHRTPVGITMGFTAEADLHADLRTVRPDAPADQPDTITQAFIEAWQGAPFTPGDVPGEAITAPPQHVGDKRPRMKVRVRNGEVRRDRRYWNSLGYPVGASVASSSNVHPWQATWHPHTPWRTVDGVMEVELGKSFDQNGVGTATIQVANVAYPENEGGGHDVRRGFMAPLRGYSPPSLPLKHPPEDLDGVAVDANEWGDTWKAKVQVEVFQTYGDAPWVKTFTGVVDDIDDTSRPDVLTLTCRDFGAILVDSHIFGWNKDPHIRGPVIFVGHDEAYSLSHSAYNPNASSRIANHHSDLAVDDDRRTYWRSGVGSAGETEWIEFDVAEGFYEDIYIDGRFLDSSGDWDKHYDDVYVSIRPTAMAGGASPTREGVDLDTGVFADIGAGDTPRGTPYVAHYSSVGAAAKRALGGRFKLGRGSTIRITFSGLPSLPGGGHAAGARDLYAVKEKLAPDAIHQRWVVVEDISDVVKVILRWAGFKEWEVESTGAQLPRRLVFQPGDTYMDAINKVADAIGYTFFMKDPTASSGSLGVPVFRKSWALVNDGMGRNRRLTITDRVLLTGVNVKDSEEELRTTIRTLGRESDKGTNFGFGGAKRIIFFYRPPWALRNFTDDRVGGILKHAVYTNPLWKTIDLCRFAAYDIALKEAMAQIVGSAEFPGTGSVDLDEHVLISDLGTGVISRLWVTNRNSTFVAGEKAKWTMTTAGGLIDVPNVQAMVEVINDAAERA